MNNDLTKKSEAELEELATMAATLLKERRDSRRNTAIAQIKEIAAAANITVTIKGERKSKQSAEATGKIYQNPDDPNQQWSGKGFEPKWLRALVKSGRNRDEFLVAIEQQIAA